MGDTPYTYTHIHLQHTTHTTHDYAAMKNRVPKKHRWSAIDNSPMSAIVNSPKSDQEGGGVSSKWGKRVKKDKSKKKINLRRKASNAD